jgi:hypothetical protein
MCQNLGGVNNMDETLQEAAQESSPADSRIWIGRILIGVILGEAVWGFLVSITNNLALPAMARVLGGDPQSPLYLGKGDFNVPGLFTAVLELCFAGIVAVILNSWSQKGRRVRTVKTVRIASTAVPSIAPPVRAPEPPSTPAPQPATPANTTVTAAQPTPPPMPPQSVAKPAKPKPPKEVYYNIVGEPIERDDE